MAAFQLVDRLNNETLFHTIGRGNISLGEAIVKENEYSSLGSPVPGHLLASEIESPAGLEEDAPQMGQFERLFWILIFSLMVLIAVGGNTIVVYIVSTNREMKSVTNYFLVNLSLADTMVSTLNVIFNLISMLNSHWPFGETYCKISNFIAILSISASVFTLTAISCDRYNAILHPLRPRMSHRRAIGWILLIWSLSGALATPNAIYSKLDGNETGLTCAMNWADGKASKGQSSYDLIYNFVILIVTYLVPILTMAILYYKVGKELWGSEAIGENIDKQQRALLAKKKIVKMMIVVVIIFALCWLPYHAFFLFYYYVPISETSNSDMGVYQRCYLIMYWLAMSNSMYNPIIIYFMNSKFRHEFRKILCFLLLCRIYIPPSRSIISSNTYNITVTMAANQAAAGGGGVQRGHLFARKAIRRDNSGGDNDSATQCTLLNYSNDNGGSGTTTTTKSQLSSKIQNNCRLLTPAAPRVSSGGAQGGCDQSEEFRPFIARMNGTTATDTDGHKSNNNSSRTSTINDPASVSNSKSGEKLIDHVNGPNSCKSSTSTGSSGTGNVSRQDQNNNKVWI